MSKKYTPAVFQPTVRPSWVGALSYIPLEEQAAILKAILSYPNDTHINSNYWNETIAPDLEAQHSAFVKSCEDRGRGSRDYWNSKKTLDKHKENISYPNDNDKVTSDKDKSKSKDKEQSKEQDKEKSNSVSVSRTAKTFSYTSLPLFAAFSRWIEYKKSRKEMYKSPMSVEAAYKRLNDLSGGNLAVAEKIVEQSIGNDWQGLFHLREVTQTRDKNLTGAEPYHPEEAALTYEKWKAQQKAKEAKK